MFTFESVESPELHDSSEEAVANHDNELTEEVNFLNNGSTVLNFLLQYLCRTFEIGGIVYFVCRVYWILKSVHQKRKPTSEVIIWSFQLCNHCSKFVYAFLAVFH